jgi:hypothetical protein
MVEQGNRAFSIRTAADPPQSFNSGGTSGICVDMRRKLESEKVTRFSVLDDGEPEQTA